MKKTNKKGFTIVELVIVIAVIAILAGVLIPTFAGVIEKANESKELQQAQNAYKEVLVDRDAAIPEGSTDIEKNGYTFKFNGGKLNSVEGETEYTYEVDSNGNITGVEKTASST